VKSIVHIRDLTYSYRRQQRRLALDSVNLEIFEGEFVAIAGRAGAGKSSLCYALNGLIPHSFGGRMEGDVYVCGLNTRHTFVPDLARHVGFVLQNAESQLVGLTVEEDVSFGLENIALPRSEVALRVAAALKTVHLENYPQRSPWTLSGGQKQRLAIAAALAFQPELLVLDNPTAELDPVGKQEVMSTLGRLNHEHGVTLIVVNPELEEMLPYASRVVLMESGKVTRQGTPAEVLDSTEEVERVGLRLPDIVQVASQLRARKRWTGMLPITIDDAAAGMRSLVSDSHRPNKAAPGKKPAREPLIEMEDVSFSYPDGTPVLRNINLTVRHGEFVTLMGPNGAGKTTLAKHMNGLLAPTSGQVRVRGIDTRDTTVTRLAKTVGYVFQNPDHQLFCRSTAEELAFGPRNLGWTKNRVDEAVRVALERLGEGGRGNEDPFFMGLAERKLIAIASVLVMEPKMLVLDEPATGADHDAALRIMNYLARLHRQGMTIVIVTHDVSLAANYAERIVALRAGEVVLDGPPSEVFVRHELLSCLITPPQVTQLAQKLDPSTSICRIHELVELLGAS
jgi:energy-coupling factor transport system ATP-binding protein